MALRRAAFRLFEAQGYEATSTEEIARAAGVSPRTFFNYFPTKEALFFLPNQPVIGLVAASLRSRPTGEHPATSLASTSMGFARMLGALISSDDLEVAIAGLRLLLVDPECSRFLQARRRVVEQAAWTTLIERGSPPDDLATKALVVAVVGVTLFALEEWVSSDGTESLPALVARCLLGLAAPAALAAGIVENG